METNSISVVESVPASRKLQASDAQGLLKSAKKMIACKGKKVQTFELGGAVPEEAVQAMLGPTGNLRSPTVVAGSTLVVGYNDEVFADVLG